MSPATSPRDLKFLGFNFSPFNSPAKKTSNENLFNNMESSPKKKRSRSLIRRGSKKSKQIEKVHNPEDCIIS